MRTLTRSWKGRKDDTGRLQPVRHSFTHRYRVYRGAEGDERLWRVRLEDEEGSANHYPVTSDDLEALLLSFKEGRINAFGRPIREGN